MLTTAQSIWSKMLPIKLSARLDPDKIVFKCVSGVPVKHWWLTGLNRKFQGELHQISTSKYFFYRFWRVCVKPFVVPEGAVWNLTMCLRWCHLSQSQLGLKTTSLKMKRKKKKNKSGGVDLEMRSSLLLEDGTSSWGTASVRHRWRSCGTSGSGGEVALRGTDQFFTMSPTMTWKSKGVLL